MRMEIYHSHLMRECPSFQVNPLQLSRKEKIVKGDVDIKDLARASELTNSGADKVDFCFSFGIDSDGNCCVDFQIEVEAKLICQRCLRPIEEPVKIKSGMVFLETERQEINYSGDYEVYLFPELREKGAMLSLLVVVEDELLLGWPMVPLHKKDKDCLSLSANPTSVDDKKQSSDTEKKRPFAKLDKMLREASFKGRK